MRVRIPGLIISFGVHLVPALRAFVTLRPGEQGYRAAFALTAR